MSGIIPISIEMLGTYPIAGIQETVRYWNVICMCSRYVWNNTESLVALWPIPIPCSKHAQNTGVAEQGGQSLPQCTHWGALPLQRWPPVYTNRKLDGKKNTVLKGYCNHIHTQQTSPTNSYLHPKFSRVFVSELSPKHTPSHAPTYTTTSTLLQRQQIT